jgi:PIN domain nuclease of toxin-antitoxin system
MRFLLDTHIILWSIQNDSNLSDKCKEILSNTENILYSSIVSEWEIAIKSNIGKLKLNGSVNKVFEEINSLDILPLEISRLHLAQYENLPLHHRDPFDRLLIAQAITEDLVLITNDEHFKPYNVKYILNQKI